MDTVPMETHNLVTLTVIVLGSVCAVGLIIALFMYWRSKIEPDNNVRKRVLAKLLEGYDRQEVRQEKIFEPEPIRVPVQRRELIQEPVTIPPPPPQAPQPADVVVHEVVHRYEPTAPTPPEPHRCTRRNSWSEGHHCRHNCSDNNDEWVMIKKKRKGTKVRNVCEEDSSDEETCRHKNRRRVTYVSPSLSAYDLAVPAQHMMVGAEIGTPTYMVAKPTAVPMVPASSAFQPAYLMTRM